MTTISRTKARLAADLRQAQYQAWLLQCGQLMQRLIAAQYNETQCWRSFAAAWAAKKDLLYDHYKAAQQYSPAAFEALDRYWKHIQYGQLMGFETDFEPKQHHDQ